MSWFKKTPPTAPAPTAETKKVGFFSTDTGPVLKRTKSQKSIHKTAFERSFQRPQPIIQANGAYTVEGTGMDASVKENLNAGRYSIPDAQLLWYGSQGFPGYQILAILMQNWLIDKCCTMPAEDAVRNGFDITVNDGEEVDTPILDQLRSIDKRMSLNENMVQLERYARAFGIRIAIPIVDLGSPDANKEFYENPFNADAITPGSYQGISQVDPYWITPELDGEAAANPMAKDFYEPTWWRVNQMRIHRTHLIIVRPYPVADILKPSYLYGGLSIPQKVAERVYGAERTANEAPLLAATKRMTIIHLDTTKFLANEEEATERLEQWTQFMNNFAVKVVGEDEQIEQFDTSLADLDAVIMTQFQLVAAAAEVPGTKLMGTQPKGFNTTGEFESDSYHEKLESIQTHHLSQLANRHHLLAIRSEILPNNPGQKPFTTDISWKPLDTPTAKELAEINELKSRNGNNLVNSGAIDSQDERDRIVNDPDSGYNGLEEKLPEDPLNPDEEGGEGDNPAGEEDPADKPAPADADKK